MKYISTIIFSFILIISLVFSTSCSSKINFDEIKINPSKFKKIDLAASSKTGKSIFWEVTSNDKEGKAYLLGSIHIGNNSLYPLDRTIERAYLNSEVIAVEADITKMNIFSSSSYLKEAMYNDGTTLKDVLPPNLYSKLSKKLKGTMYENSFNSFKPWMVNSLLDALNIEKLNYDTDNGIDLYFLKRAHKEKKEVKELESIEFQINMLANLSEPLIFKLIEENLDFDLEEYSKEIEKMFKMWQEGDVEGIQDTALSDNSNDKLSKEYNKIILTDRNIGMKNKIIEYFNTGKTHLIIVGSAHYVGETGIIKLLQNEGYNVIQK